MFPHANDMNFCAIRSLSSTVLIVLLLLASDVRADAWLIDVEGAIGPATADHFIRGLDQAHEAGAELIVLQLDTPGGLDTAMRDMIKAILASPVGVVAYVSPSGARAASAGTYLVYASHIAAMAPGTNLGAATPVQIAAPGMDRLPGGEKQEPIEKSTSSMEEKITNDAVAYIQSLAQLRGRNVEWAERAVKEGASLSAEDALELDVVDLLADSVEELLQLVHGMEVEIDGRATVLETKDLALYQHPVDWRSDFLAVITDPNIAYFLMLVGIYGLLIEFYNPGIGLPGVLGAVCLLLALYAFQVMPISYVGLGLIFLGIGLMTAEAFAPSFGILGIGGIVSFVIGSIMLMDTELPGYQIAMPMIAGFAVFSAALLILALGLVVKSRQRAHETGIEHLLGQHGLVEILGEEGAYVRLDGELWHAECSQPLAVDDEVTVEAVDGVMLRVSKLGG